MAHPFTLAIPLRRSPTERRVFAIEVAKLVAAFGVVLIHLEPCTPQAEAITDVVRLFPVPFFFISAVHFTIRRILTNGGAVSRVLSLSRLIWPYAVWTVLYLLLRWVKSGNILLSNSLGTWFGFLFVGQSAVHLYFLPLLIYYQIVAASSVIMCSNLLSRRIHLSATCWLAGAFVIAVAFDRAGYFGWTNALLSGLVYTFLGAIPGALDNRIGRRWNVVVVIAATVMMAFALVAWFGIKLPQFYYFLHGPVFGCCALIVLLRFPGGKPDRWMAGLASCYFGVYLAHHGIEEGLEMVCAKFGHVLPPYDVLSRVGVALMTFCGGILITCLIRLSPRLAFWMLGEARQVETK